MSHLKSPSATRQAPAQRQPSRRGVLAAAVVVPFSAAAAGTWWAVTEKLAPGSRAQREEHRRREREAAASAERTARALEALRASDSKAFEICRSRGRELGLPEPRLNQTPGAFPSTIPTGAASSPAFQLALSAVSAAGSDQTARGAAWGWAVLIRSAEKPDSPVTAEDLGELAAGQPGSAALASLSDAEFQRAVRAADRLVYWAETKAAQAEGEARDQALAQASRWADRTRRLRGLSSAPVQEEVAFTRPTGVTLDTAMAAASVEYSTALRASMSGWPREIPKDLITLTLETFRI